MKKDKLSALILITLTSGVLAYLHLILKPADLAALILISTVMVLGFLIGIVNLIPKR